MFFFFLNEFFSSYFKHKFDIRLVPNDILGEKKKKKTREKDIRISYQYQMICKGKKTKKEKRRRKRKQKSKLWQYGGQNMEVNLLTI